MFENIGNNFDIFGDELGSASLDCMDDTCIDSDIHCSNEQCQINCWNCNNANITADQGVNLEINCIGDQSCIDATITSGANGVLDVYCGGDMGCNHLQIHAEESSDFSLTLEGIITEGLSIWFPLDAADITITDNNAMIAENAVMFYTVNGWTNINIDQQNVTSQDYNYGTMYYCSDYTGSCDTTWDWRCEIGDGVCVEGLADGGSPWYFVLGIFLIMVIVIYVYMEGK